MEQSAFKLHEKMSPKEYHSESEIPDSYFA